MKSALLALVLCACSSSSASTLRVDVAMPKSRFPVSMTESLIDDDGIVPPSRIQVVGALQHKSDCTPTGRTIDLSEAINRQVEAARGQAITSFSLSVEEEGECLEVAARGKIVKVR